MKNFVITTENRGWPEVFTTAKFSADMPKFVIKKLLGTSACAMCGSAVKHDCTTDADGFNDSFYVCTNESCGHIVESVAELGAKPEPCRLCGRDDKVMVGIDMTEVSYAIGEGGNMLPGFTTFYNVCVDCVDAFVQKVKDDVEQAYADGYCGDE